MAFSGNRRHTKTRETSRLLNAMETRTKFPCALLYSQKYAPPNNLLRKSSEVKATIDVDDLSGAVGDGSGDQRGDRPANVRWSSPAPDGGKSLLDELRVALPGAGG